MNRIFKLKYSQQQQQLVVVSELADNTVAHTNTTTARQHTTSDHSQSVLTSLVRKVSLSGVLLSASVVVSPALALGAGQVVAGQATIATNGQVTTITNSPNTIINWQSFNIKPTEIVKFVQQSAQSSVLNRVLGNQVSQILGTLESNGKVFLVNPNGIVFGKHASVNVQSLVASTLDIKNTDFLQGKYVFNQAKDHVIANVINQGMIKVQADGSLALIGGAVVNAGTLQAKNGTVYLLAGHTIEIADLHNPLISYKVTAKNKAVNLGQILAKQVQVTAHSIYHGDAAQAPASFADIVGAGNDSADQARITATGQVELFGGSEADSLQTTQQSNAQVVGKRTSQVINNGVIDVSSHGTTPVGKVRILGDTVLLNNHSQILATASSGIGGEVVVGGDARGKGAVKLATNLTTTAGQVINVTGNTTGGHIVLWGDVARFRGNLVAQSTHGTGGLVETSGKLLDLDDPLHLHVNTSSGLDAGNALRPHSGTWLIDPGNLVVYGKRFASNYEPAKNWLRQQGINLGSNTRGKRALYSANGRDTFILDSDLQEYLGYDNKIELDATNSIYFTYAKVKAAGASLTLIPQARNGGYGVKIHETTIGLQYLNFTKDTTGTHWDDPTYTNTANTSITRSFFDLYQNFFIHGSRGGHVDIIDSIFYFYGKYSGFYDEQNRFTLGNGQYTVNLKNSEFYTYWDYFNNFQYTDDVEKPAAYLDFSVNRNASGTKNTLILDNATVTNLYGGINLSASNLQIKNNSNVTAGSYFTVQAFDQGSIDHSLFVAQTNTKVHPEVTSWFKAPTITSSSSADAGNFVISNSVIKAPHAVSFVRPYAEGTVPDKAINFDINSTKISATRLILLNNPDSKNITTGNQGLGAIRFYNDNLNIPGAVQSYSTDSYTNGNNNGHIVFNHTCITAAHFDLNHAASITVENHSCLTSKTYVNFATQLGSHGETGDIRIHDSCITSSNITTGHGWLNLSAAGQLDFSGATLTNNDTQVFTGNTSVAVTGTNFSGNKLIFNNQHQDKSTITNSNLSSKDGAIYINTKGADNSGIVVEGSNISTNTYLVLNGTNFTANTSVIESKTKNLIVGHVPEQNGSIHTIYACGTTFASHGEQHDIWLNAQHDVTLTGDATRKSNFEDARQINITADLATGLVRVSNTDFRARTLNITSAGVIFGTGTHAEILATSPLSTDTDTSGAAGETPAEASSDIPTIPTPPPFPTTSASSSTDTSTTPATTPVAGAGNIGINAVNGSISGAGANLHASNNLYLLACSAATPVVNSIDLGDSQLTAQAGKIYLQANITDGSKVILNNVGLTSAQAAEIYTDSNLTISNSQIINTIKYINTTVANQNGVFNLHNSSVTVAGLEFRDDFKGSYNLSDSQLTITEGTTGTLGTSTPDATLQGFAPVGTSPNGFINIQNTTLTLAKGDVDLYSRIAKNSGAKYHTTISDSHINQQQPTALGKTRITSIGSDLQVHNSTFQTPNALILNGTTVTANSSHLHGYSIAIDAVAAKENTNAVILDQTTLHTNDADTGGTTEQDKRKIVVDAHLGNLSVTSGGAYATSALQLRGKNITVANSNLTANNNEVSIGDLHTNQVFLSGGEVNTLNTNPVHPTDVGVHGEHGVTVTGTNFNSGRDFNLSAPEGIVTVSTSQINVTRDINITAENIITKAANIVKAVNVTLNATKTDVSFSDNSFHINHNLKIIAYTGNLTTDHSTFTSDTGNVSLLAGKNLQIQNGTSLVSDATEAGTGNIELLARQNVTILASTARAANTDGLLNITGQQVHTEGAILAGAKAELNATTKDLKVDSTCITTASGNLTLQAATDISTTNHSKLQASRKSVVVTAGNNLSLDSTSINSSESTLLRSPDTISLTSTTVNATTGEISVGDLTTKNVTISGATTELTTGSGDIGVHGDNSVVVKTQARLHSGRDLNLSVPNGSLFTEQASLTAVRDINLTAQTTELQQAQVAAHNISVTATSGAINLTASTLDASTGAVGLSAATDVQANQSLVVSGDSLKVTAHNISLSAGSNFSAVKEHSDVSLVATNNLSVNASSVTAPHDVTLQAVNTTVTNSSISATTGNTLVKGDTDLRVTAGSKLHAGNDLTLNSTTGNVYLEDSNASTATGIAAVQAHGNISLTNANVAGVSVNLDSPAGNISVTTGSLAASMHDVTVTAGINATLSEVATSAQQSVKVAATTQAQVTGGSITTTTGDIEIGNATTATAVVSDTCLTATAGNVSLHGNSQAMVSNSKLHAGLDINVASPSGEVTIKATSVLDAKRSINITAPTVQVQQATLIAKNHTSINATTGNVTIDASNVNSTQGEVSLVAANQVQLQSHTNVAAETSLVARADTLVIANSNLTTHTGQLSLGNLATNNVSISDSELNSTSNDVNVHGKQQVVLDQTTAHAGRDLNISSPAGSVNVRHSSKLLADRTINITAPTVTLSNSHVDTANVSLNATTGTLSLQGTPINATQNIQAVGQEVTGSAGSQLNAGGNVSVQARAGNVTLPGASIHGDQVQITASKNISLPTSSIQANQQLQLQAGQNLTASGGTYVSNTSNIDLNASQNVFFDQATACATLGSVNVHATAGNFTAHGSSLSSPCASVNLQVAKDVTLVNTNVASFQDLGITAQNISIQDHSNLTTLGAQGNLTLTAEQNLTITGQSQVTAPNNVSLTATNELQVSNAQVQAGKHTSLTATTGNVTLNQQATITGDSVIVTATAANVTTDHASLTSTGGNVTLDAHQAVTTNNSSLLAQDSVLVRAPEILADSTSLNATTGEVSVGDTHTNSVTLTNSTLVTHGTGAGADVGVHASDKIVLDHTQAHASHDLNLSSPTGTVVLQNHSNITADHIINITAQVANISTSQVTANNKLVVQTTQDTNIQAGSNLSGASVLVGSSAGNVAITQANVTATVSNVTLAVPAGNTTLSQANMTANAALVVTGTYISATGSKLAATHDELSVGNLTTASVKLSTSELTTTDSDIGVHGTQEAVLDHTSTHAGRDLNLSAPDGTVTIHNGSVVTAVRTINITAHNVNLTDSQVTSTGGNVSLLADTGELKLANTPVVAKQDLTAIGNSIAGSAGSQLTAGNDVTINATGASLELPGAVITAQAGNASVTAHTSVNLSQSSVVAAKDVTLVAHGGDLTATGGKYVSNTTNVELGAQDNIAFNDAQATATQGNINVHATQGDFSATNASLAAPKHAVQISVGQDVKLANTTVVSQDDLTIAAQNISATAGSKLTSTGASTNVSLQAQQNLTLTDSTVTAAGNVTTHANKQQTVSNTSITAGKQASLTATQGLSLHNGTQVHATKVNVATTSGNVTVIGTNLTATSGNATIAAPGHQVTLTNTNVAAQQAVLVAGATITGDQVSLNATTDEVSVGNSQTNQVSLTNSKLVATAHDVGVHGQQGVSVSNTQLHAGRDLNLSAPAGTVSILDHSNLTAGHTINLTAQSLIIKDSELQPVGDDLVLNATNGNITLSNTNVSAPHGNLSVTATDNITLSNINATAHNITAHAGNNVIVNNSTLNATIGSTQVIAGKDLALGNGTQVTAQQQVKLVATTGNLSLVGSNVTSVHANTSLVAKHDITLTHSNVTAEQAVIVHGDTITGTGTKLVAHTDEVSVGNTTTNKVSFTDSIINSTTGDVGLHGNQGVTVSSSQVHAGRDLNLSAPDGTVQVLNGSKLSATRTINLTAQAVTVTHSDLTPGTDLTVNATKGDIQVSDSNLSVTHGNVTMTATANTSLSNTNVTAYNISVTTGKDLIANNTTLNATVATTSLTAGDNLSLGNGTQVIAPQEVTVVATTGNVTTIGTNITSLTANTTIKAKQQVTMTNTNVTADQGVIVRGSEIIGQDSKLHAHHNEVSVGDQATNKVKLTGGSVTSDEQDVGLHGEQGVTVSGTSVHAGRDLNLSAPAGTVSVLDGSKLTATRTINLTAQAVTITNSNVTPGTDLTVNATQGDVTVSNNNLTVTTGNATITASDRVTMANSNVTALNISTTAGTDLSIANTTLHATQGTNSLTAGNNLQLGNGTTVTAPQEVTVVAKKGSVTATGSNLTSTTANVTILAPKKVTLTNTNVTADGAAIVRGDKIVGANAHIHAKRDEVSLGNLTTNTVSLTGGSITSDNSDVGIHGDKQVTVSHVQVHAGRDLNLSAPHGTVEVLDHSKLTATRTINLTAQSVAIKDSDVQPGTDLTVNATQGDLTVTNSNLTVPTGNATITAIEQVTIANSNVTAKHITTTAGSNATINNSTLHATQGSNILTAGDNVNLGNGTQITANKQVRVIATTGNVTAVGSNITSVTANATIKAPKQVTLTNTNVTADQAVVVRGEQITGKDSNIHAKHNQVSLGDLNTNKVDFTGGSIASDTNDVGLHGKHGVSVSHVQVHAGRDLNLSAPAGEVQVLDHSNLTAGRTINITAQAVVIKDSTATQGTDLTINATQGSVDVVHSYLNTTNGNLTVTATDNVSFTSSNATAKRVDVTAGNDLTVNNTTLCATTSSNTLTAGNNVHLGNGTNVTAKQDVIIVAKTGNITAIGSNITAEMGNATLTSPKQVTLVNTNVTADQVVKVRAPDITLTGSDIHAKHDEISIGDNSTNTVTISGSNLVTDEHDLGVHGKHGITTSNSNFNAGRDLNLAAPEGKVIIGGSSLTAGRTINITAPEGSVITKSHLKSGHNISLTSAGDIELHDNGFTANTAVIFDTKSGKGKITATNTDGNAPDIYINDQTPNPVILTNNKWHGNRVHLYPRSHSQAEDALTNLLGQLHDLQVLRHLVARDVGRDVEYTAISTNRTMTYSKFELVGPQRYVNLELPAASPDIFHRGNWLTTIGVTSLTPTASNNALANTSLLATCDQTITQYLTQYHLSLADLHDPLILAKYPALAAAVATRDRCLAIIATAKNFSDNPANLPELTTKLGTSGVMLLKHTPTPTIRYHATRPEMLYPATGMSYCAPDLTDLTNILLLKELTFGEPIHDQSYTPQLTTQKLQGCAVPVPVVK